jgi:hypothetical protein
VGLLEARRHCWRLFLPHLLRFTSMKEMVMAKLIEFYVPTNFRTPLKGTSPRRGKVIEFCPQIKKSVERQQSVI